MRIPWPNKGYRIMAKQDCFNLEYTFFRDRRPNFTAGKQNPATYEAILITDNFGSDIEKHSLTGEQTITS